MSFQYYLLENGTDRYLLENGTDLFLTEASAHVVEAVAAAAGVATDSVIGAAIVAGVGSSAGVASSSGIGALVLPGVASSAGVASSSGIGATVGAGVGSSAGVASSSVIGATVVAGVGSSAGVAGAGQSFTDDFTGTNGTSPPNANWSVVRGAMEIQSNQVAGGDNDDVSCIRWNANDFADAHYSKLTFASTYSPSGTMCIGPAIRCQSGADSFYFCFGREPGGDLFIGEWVAGSFTSWEIITGGMPAVGTVMELAIDATTSTTVYYKENGVVIKTYTGKNALSGGSPGICSYLNYESHRGDDWQGGNVADATGVSATVCAGVGSSAGVGAAAGISGATCASVAFSAGVATVIGEGENIGLEVEVETSLGGELIGKRRRPRLRWSEAGDPDPTHARAWGSAVLQIEFSTTAKVAVNAFASGHALTLLRSDAPTLCTAGAVARSTSTSERRAPRASDSIESGSRGAQPSDYSYRTRVLAVRNPTEEDLMLTHLSLIE